MTSLAIWLCAAIVAILVGRAAWVLRAERDTPQPRGVEPGRGYTEIESQYFSGVGGGNQQITRVPRDPQEYARAFVPRRKDTANPAADRPTDRRDDDG
ncbi:MAG: hypothetical protein AAF919_03270 [Pseudomonadota bacterium]